MPCRRAVAETNRGPARLSSTMRAFSSSDQARRRPVSTISMRPKTLCVGLSIRTALSRQPTPPQGGPRRKLTLRRNGLPNDINSTVRARQLRPSITGQFRQQPVSSGMERTSRITITEDESGSYGNATGYCEHGTPELVRSRLASMSACPHTESAPSI